MDLLVLHVRHCNRRLKMAPRSEFAVVRILPDLGGDDAQEMNMRKTAGEPQCREVEQVVEIMFVLLWGILIKSESGTRGCFVQ